jgi:hypothetical protein
MGVDVKEIINILRCYRVGRIRGKIHFMWYPGSGKPQYLVSLKTGLLIKTSGMTPYTSIYVIPECIYRGCGVNIFGIPE